MNVLILAAGYGTRLYPLVRDTPKALLPVNSKSLIDYVLEKVQHLPQLSSVLVVTNNKFCKIFDHWAQGHRNFPVKIEIINDGTNTPADRLGSMGDINYVIKNHQIADDLLIIGGDNLFDEPLEDFLQFARKNPPFVTIGLYDIKEKSKAKIFGVVELDPTHRLISFEEKPSQPKSSLIAMCLYFYPRASLGLVARYLLDTQRTDTAGDYIKWLYQKEPVYGFKFQGKWYDIGSVESYKEASENFRK